VSEALLHLSGIGRCFVSDAGPVPVLSGIELEIHAGEMVAIIGASGSGKSTLMNLLGCLDRPDSGCYRIGGIDVAALDDSERARLRREHFGFVFQRYHLLPHLDAVDNVAMPAVYSGVGLAARRARAAGLLGRLGLAELTGRRPSQLSGGQQQRVSIARALMNGGEVILADEPTGALDSQSGREVLALLRELNLAGHTVIIVTHDRDVAAEAGRIIELRDGEVIADSGVARRTDAVPPVRRSAGEHGMSGRVSDACKMALHALRANRLRTLLTMLGIIIGIASVVSILALGQGARDAVLKEIREIGTNTVMVYRGSSWADDRAAGIRTLLPFDLQVLAAEPYVDSVTPLTDSNLRLRAGAVDATAMVVGGGADVFRVYGRKIQEGRTFTAGDVARQAQVVVLDANARNRLFGKRARALGEVVMVGSMPAEVIGVVSAAPSDSWRAGLLGAWLPYSTAASRLFGQPHFDQLTIRVRDGVSMALAEAQITRLLVRLHGSQDFHTENLDTIYKSMNRVVGTLSLLLALVALISLLVGGIGVMNIMLVSVAERTREIGIRMAVGARPQDVRLQFLIEAVVVCLIGGAIGIALALSIGGVFALFVDAFDMVFSPGAILLACACSMLVGVLFGYLPARNAARLDPVVALARE
jgi:macrolide transport system ATP-binding/permease protein